MTDPAPAFSPYLTLAQVAERLNIPRSQVRALIDRGALPVYRFGPKTLRIHTQDLEDYEHGQRDDPKAQAQDRVRLLDHL